MVGNAKPFGHQAIVEAVASSVATRVQKLAHTVGWDIGPMAMISGKMLRTRLAARIAGPGGPLERPALINLCAATELLHLASLCHDNVAGTGPASRRQRPLWLTPGASIAVLLGDLLLVDATQIVVATRGGRHVKDFLDKAKEVLESEVRQEVHWPEGADDLALCQRLARGKTGPLFAFTAALGGTDDDLLFPALEEAGYQVGTAYQLADDFLDPTDAQTPDARCWAQARLAALCQGALQGLRAWPDVQARLARFLAHDLQPALAGKVNPPTTLPTRT